MDHAVNIELLPDHLLVQIFDYVTFKFRLDTLAIVSRRWSELVFSPQLWPYANVRVYDMKFFHQYINPTLKKIAGGLKSIDLHVRHNEDMPELISAMPPMHNLIDLHSSTGFTVSILHSFALKCPSIRNFRIECSGSYYDTIDTMYWRQIDDAALMVLATEWSCLRQLDIRYGKKFTQSGVMAFIKSAQQIDSLNLVDFELSTETIELLGDKHGNSLKSVGLHGKSIPDAIRTLAKAAPKIVNLFIGDSQLYRSPECIMLWQSVVTCLQKFKHLRDLHVDCSSPIQRGRFAQLFTHFPQLTCLHMYNQDLDDVGLDSLATNCPLLKCLYIGGPSFVTDIGAESVVTKCRNLQFLSLDCLKGKCEILGSVPDSNLPHLRYLSVVPSNHYHTCQQVSDATIDELLKRTDSLIVNHRDFGYSGMLLQSANGVVTKIRWDKAKAQLEPLLKRICNFTDFIPAMLF